MRIRFSDYMNGMVNIYYDLLEIQEKIFSWKAVSTIYNLSTDDFSIFMLHLPHGLIKQEYFKN